VAKVQFPPRFDGESWTLIRRLWHDWLKKDWRRMIVAFVLMAVVAATTGAYPLLIERAYTLFEQKNMEMILLLPLAILFVTAAKGGAFYAQNVLTGAIVNNAVRKMQLAMFNHFMAADLAQVTRHPTGTLITRFTNDLGMISNAFGRTLTNSIRDVLTVIALVGAMFYLDWVLALIVLVVYPLAAIPIIEVGRRLKKVAKSTQVHMGETTAFLGESLSGIRMVKTYGLERYEEGRADGIFQRLYDLTLRRIKARARLDPLLEVLGGLAVAGVIVFGGYRIAAGHGTVGGFTGFVSALLIAAQPVRSIGQLNAAIQEGLAAAKRYYDMYDEKPDIAEEPNAKPLQISKGRIVLSDVVFGYGAADEANPGDAAKGEEAGERALNGIDIVIESGQTVALVGPSGAGKSTVMNLIPRLFDVEAGSVTIAGEDVRAVTLESLRAACAFVSQDVVLFDDTIRQNIAFGHMGADDAAVEAAAEAAAAARFIAAMPEGYETPVGDKGHRLSGGERQRISIARAILKDAPILLLDEATSALDAESEHQIQAALERLSQGRTDHAAEQRLGRALGQRHHRQHRIDPSVAGR